MALQFAEMCLGHELTSPNGGPSAHYQIAVARLYMHHHNYAMAIECLRNAIVLDIQVQEYTKSIIIGKSILYNWKFQLQNFHFFIFTAINFCKKNV